MAATLSLIFRIIIGGIFLIAGLAKISDPVRFMLTLREFDMFPRSIIPFLAVFLPWLELILGMFIVIGLLYRTSAFMLAAMNIMFTLAILSVIIRGLEIDCGCFGLLADVLKLPDMADYKAVIRNLIFTGICFYIALARQTIISLEGYLTRKNNIR